MDLKGEYTRLLPISIHKIKKLELFLALFLVYHR